MMTVETWIWLNQYGIPEALGWARQRPPEVSGPLLPVTSPGPQNPPQVPVPGSRPPLEVYSNLRVGLPAMPGGIAP